MRFLLAGLLSFALISADARALAQRSSRTLKQATREEIVDRASRPRPKRATISNGVIPSASNQQTFVMRATNSGNPGVDGNYAMNDPGQYAWGEFKAPTVDTAATYFLDSNGHLFNSNGLAAWADPMVKGQSYIYYAAPGDQDIDGANVKCTISPSSTLSCYADNGSAVGTLGVCNIQNNKILGLNFGTGASCIPAQFNVYAASP